MTRNREKTLPFGSVQFKRNKRTCQKRELFEYSFRDKVNHSSEISIYKLPFKNPFYIHLKNSYNFFIVSSWQKIFWKKGKFPRTFQFSQKQKDEQPEKTQKKVKYTKLIWILGCCGIFLLNLSTGFGTIEFLWRNKNEQNGTEQCSENQNREYYKEKGYGLVHTLRKKVGFYF